jgi:hypothetical protein
VIVGNLGAQKEKRNDTPISAKKDIMGDKTVRVRADLHHIIKIETAKNGGNVFRFFFLSAESSFQFKYNKKRPKILWSEF